MTHPATLLKISWQAYFKNIKTWILLAVPIIGLAAFFIIVSLIINGDTSGVRAVGLLVATRNKTIALLVFTILAAIFIGRTMANAMVFSASKALQGEKITFGVAYRHSLKTFWPVFWVSIVRALIVIGGLILLIVPGVIWALRYSFTTQAIVVEGKRGREAFRRSKELTQGKLLETLIDFATLGAIIKYAIFIALFAMVIVILVLGSIASFAASASANEIISTVIGGAIFIVWAITIMLSLPLSPIAFTAIYKDFSSK
jgi:hypothetical protein